MNENKRQNQESEIGFLDKRGLAEKLKCTTRTIESMMALHQLPYVRIGKKLVRFDWEKVREELNRQRN